MGEKKMLKKERKSPSQKKEKKSIVAAKPTRYSLRSCPSLFHNLGDMRRLMISNLMIKKSGKGGITKTWISSPSSACRDRIHQTWPQLVETNISPHHRTSNPTFEEFQFRVSNYNGKYVSEIVVTGVSSPAFAFYKRDAKDFLYRREWRMRDCRIVEPFSGDDRYVELTNVIGFKGKFYAISRQGSLVLIEDKGNKGNFEITALGRNRVVPYCKVSKHFREYLLVCEKEVYVVFLLSSVSINKVDDVEVYRLDTWRLLLEKVDRLKDDEVFFLQDDQCIGVSARLLGCSKGSNCVYFTHGRADGCWFVYDMEASCISVTQGPEFDLPTSRR